MAKYYSSPKAGDINLKRRLSSVIAELTKVGRPKAVDMTPRSAGRKKAKSQTAKLFKNGRSQAVRLPAKYRFEGDEVFISRVGDKVILSNKPASWDDFFDAGPKAPANFMSRRKDAPPQKRRLFK